MMVFNDLVKYKSMNGDDDDIINLSDSSCHIYFTESIQYFLIDYWISKKIKYRYEKWEIVAMIVNNLSEKINKLCLSKDH